MNDCLDLFSFVANGKYFHEAFWKQDFHDVHHSFYTESTANMKISFDLKLRKYVWRCISVGFVVPIYLSLQVPKGKFNFKVSLYWRSDNIFAIAVVSPNGLRCWSNWSAWLPGSIKAFEEKDQQTKSCATDIQWQFSFHVGFCLWNCWALSELCIYLHAPLNLPPDTQCMVYLHAFTPKPTRRHSIYGVFPCIYPLNLPFVGKFNHTNFQCCGGGFHCH